MNADFDGTSLGRFGQRNRQSQQPPQNVCFDLRSINSWINRNQKLTLVATDLKVVVFKSYVNGGGIDSWNFDLDHDSFLAFNRGVREVQNLYLIVLSNL